ncbi:MAG: hypothetical protein ACTSX0_08635 [Promethearchaeota archaeon]
MIFMFVFGFILLIIIIRLISYGINSSSRNYNENIAYEESQNKQDSSHPREFEMEDINKSSIRKFCANCGYQIETEQNLQEIEYCTNCGMKL